MDLQLVALVGGFALAGIPLYLLLKAIAKRIVKPKAAIVLSTFVAGALAALLGDVLAAAGIVAVICGVVDLLRSTKPIEG